ncbi:diguanylate cyclase [Endozoicomonas sp. SESOKO1]|uniref:diguanylate cyclase n=1 Tax=Endozoicomonas sp. SESOKO1 TaxID=2828742 RepID=UPI0021476AF8|nr:diguanylate cyclase [Endozoicomonas sp. SESOKO1]
MANREVAMFRKSAALAMPAILMTLVLTASLTLLTLHFKNILLESYQNKLHQVAEITSRILRDDIELHGDNHFDFDVIATDIGVSADIRVTIINEHGVVIGDSQVAGHELARMDNHGSRPEVLQAIEHGSGASTRHSHTKGYDLMYYAVKVEVAGDNNHNHSDGHESASHISDVGETYIIRTSIALNLFTNELMWLWVWVIVISLLGVLVVIMITRFFSSMLDKQAKRERESLKSEVKERTLELSLMQRLGSLMSACTTIDSAANVVHPIAAHLLPGCRGGAITLIKSSRNRLDLITQWGEQWQGSHRFEPSDCWSLLKGHTHFSNEDGLEIRCRHSHTESDLCQVCIPLVAQGETLGVLHLNYDGQQALENNISKAESMAEQIGLALANMRLREDLRQQAIRDPLTSLFNRRYMMDFLEQHTYSAESQNETLSVMMIDLDHFKRFNDTFGHDAGDYVLKQVAMELKQAVREGDLVCRYGGEEICIVCPNTCLETAEELGNMLVARIAGQGMQFNGQSLGNITISMGIATRFSAETNHDLLLKEADNALYQAKEQGRNRAVTSQPESSPPEQPFDEA